MLIVLPFFAFAILWRIFRLTGSEWRKASLQAVIVWAVALVMMTELLSVPSLITTGWLAAGWSLICLAGILCLARIKSSVPPRPETKPGLSSAERALLIAAGVLVAATGVLAILAPPNTWDAMEYHLPRVILWVSNHNVKLFPTVDYAQLVFGPAAEYVMLHFYLLWGGDRLVNLVNFFCFVGTIAGASLIAHRLGAGIRGQALAALFVATIPEALLEASGAMNTAGLTFWVVTAAYFMLEFNQESNWMNAVSAALAVGMAMLTKGTAYVYLPLVLLACWWMGSSGSRLRLLRLLPVLALLVVAVNAPQFWRTYQLTGSPLGMPFPDGGPRLHWMSDRITVGTVAANVMRSVALHMDTPSEAINRRTEKAFRWIIRKIGQDPDDPATIWPGHPFSTNRRSLHEIYAGNPLQLALAASAFLLALLGFRMVAASRLRWYIAGVLGALVLFCALLRWQEWLSRHHLALFALAAPVVGLVLERLLSRRVALALGILLVLSALPFAISNKIRSYVPWNRVVDIYRPRSDLYFADLHLTSVPVFEQMAERVRSSGCHDVAIKAYVPMPDSQLASSVPSFFVYPLFALLHVDGRNLRIRYVDVKNLSARYVGAGAGVSPCIVVCLDCAGRTELKAESLGSSPQTVSIANNEILTWPLRQNVTR